MGISSPFPCTSAILGYLPGHLCKKPPVQPSTYVKLAGLSLIVTAYSLEKLLSFCQFWAPENESVIRFEKLADVREKINFKEKTIPAVNL